MRTQLSASPSPPMIPDTHAEASSPRAHTGTPPESHESFPSPPHTGTPPESREPSPSQPSPEVPLNGPIIVRLRSSSPTPVPGFLANRAFPSIANDLERLALFHNFTTWGASRRVSHLEGPPVPMAIGLPISARDRRGGRQGNQPRSRVSSSPPGKRVQVDRHAVNTCGGPSRLPITSRVSIRDHLPAQGDSGTQPPTPRLIPGAPKQSTKTVEVVDLTSTPSSRSLTTAGLQFDGDLATTVPTGCSPTVSLRSVSTFTRSNARNPFSLPRTTHGPGQHQRPFTFPPPAKKRPQVNGNPGDSTPVRMARMYAQQTAVLGLRLTAAERRLNEEKVQKEEKRIADLRRRWEKSVRRRADFLKATAEPGGAPRQ